MPVPLQQPSPWDQFGTGIGDALIGVNQPFGSLAPMDPAARQSAIRSGALNLGMGMLANSRQAPMEALSGAYGQAREAGGVAQAGNMRMQQAQMEMENAKRSRALQESQYAQEQEYKAKQQAALQSFIESPPEGTDPQITWGVGLLVQSGMYDKALELATKSAGGGANGAEFGLQTVPAQDEQGNWHYFQPNKAGLAANEMKFPAGMAPNAPVGSEERAVNTKTGQGKADLKLDLPRAKAAIGDATAKIDMFLALNKSVEDNPNLGNVTGWMSYLPTVRPESAKVQADLATIKFKSGLTVLQALRDASKTGGALGAVSEGEHVMLQNYLTNLQQAQGAENIKTALKGLDEYLVGLKGRMQQAYVETYGPNGIVPSQGGVTAPPAAGDNSDPLGIR